MKLDPTTQQVMTHERDARMVSVGGLVDWWMVVVRSVVSRQWRAGIGAISALT